MDKTVVAINNAFYFDDQVVTEVTLDIQYQNYNLLHIAVNNGSDIIFGESPNLKYVLYRIPNRLLSVVRYSGDAWLNKYVTVFMIKI